MPLQEKQFDNQLPSEYLKKISESQEGKSKFKRFVQAGLNHISVTADADGTFDPGKINLYKSGTNGSIELENRYHFTNIRNCSFAWQLKKLGFEKQESINGTAPSPDIAPGAKGTLQLNLPAL